VRWKTSQFAGAQHAAGDRYIHCWGVYKRRFRITATADLTTAHHGSLVVYVEVCGSPLTPEDPYMLSFDTSPDPPQCHWSFLDTATREGEVNTQQCGGGEERHLPPTIEDFEFPPSIRVHWEYHLLFAGPEYCNPENESQISFNFEWL
jgi:hypothetical protein